MTYAQDNDLRVYGHMLVWHSQTPAWFFQDDAGTPLTTSAADQQVLRDRLRTHIFDVAEYLSDTYGEFGTDTNPLVACDVVNEVVTDGGEYADGLRRSEWYRILGEEFIDLAFQYADEAFNDEYAAPGTDRPVTLFINDYNTEQAGKQARLHALVERLLDAWRAGRRRGPPVPREPGHAGAGARDGPRRAFDDLPVVQAVTELDVTTGTPVTDGKLIEQGYYYRDAFGIFRAHAEDLFSVTVWGLDDGRSWRSDNGAPLLFDDLLQAKPAYYGIVGGDLPARQRTANVFAEDVALDDDADVGRPVVAAARCTPIEEVGGVPAPLGAGPPDRVRRRSTTPRCDATDAVEVGTPARRRRSRATATGDVEGVVDASATAADAVVVQLPLATPVAEGGTLPFDVRVVDGDEHGRVEHAGRDAARSRSSSRCRTLEVAAAATAPERSTATIDAAWADAAAVAHGQADQRAPAAPSRDVRTLWKDNTLYVLAEVTDPVVDVTGTDPWIQDSVEIYVDAGQLQERLVPVRRHADPDQRGQRRVVRHRRRGVPAEPRDQRRRAAPTTGYVVEASISLLEDGGARHLPRRGLPGQRRQRRRAAPRSTNWADPTGAGYQSTARWGVAQLVEADGGPGAEPSRRSDGRPVEPGVRLLVAARRRPLTAASRGAGGRRRSTRRRARPCSATAPLRDGTAHRRGTRRHAAPAATSSVRPVRR